MIPISIDVQVVKSTNVSLGPTDREDHVARIIHGSSAATAESGENTARAPARCSLPMKPDTSDATHERGFTPCRYRRTPCQLSSASDFHNSVPSSDPETPSHQPIPACHGRDRASMETLQNTQRDVDASINWLACPGRVFPSRNTLRPLRVL